jgi:hypothetical protein
MVTGICTSCAARSDRALIAEALAELKTLFPSLRSLQPEGGSA